MSKTTYGAGDTVTVTEFGLRNTGSGTGKIELKSWQTQPTGERTAFMNVGDDGSLAFPGNLDLNVGPIGLFAVTSLTQKGSYSFNVRLLDPTTGAQYSVSLGPFRIE
jgi:hypothetical protein